MILRNANRILFFEPAHLRYLCFKRADKLCVNREIITSATCNNVVSGFHLSKGVKSNRALAGPHRLYRRPLYTTLL